MTYCSKCGHPTHHGGCESAADFRKLRARVRHQNILTILERNGSLAMDSAVDRETLAQALAEVLKP